MSKVREGGMLTMGGRQHPVSTVIGQLRFPYASVTFLIETQLHAARLRGVVPVFDKRCEKKSERERVSE